MDALGKLEGLYEWKLIWLGEMLGWTRGARHETFSEHGVRQVVWSEDLGLSQAIDFF